MRIFTAFLLAATEASPETFILGIEASLPYATHAAERLKKGARKNSKLLADNAKAVIEAVNGARPATAKGDFLVTATVAASMSPGVPVDLKAYR